MKMYLDVIAPASDRFTRIPDYPSHTTEAYMSARPLLGKFVLPYSSTVASGNGNWISRKNRYRVALGIKVCRIKFHEYISSRVIHIRELSSFFLIQLNLIKRIVYRKLQEIFFFIITSNIPSSESNIME